jgi:hypothetical protein
MNTNGCKLGNIEVIDLDDVDEFAAQMVFVNPFAIAEDSTDPEIESLMADIEFGFGNYLEAQLGPRARKIYEYVLHATAVSLQEHTLFIEDQNINGKIIRMREISDAWREAIEARKFLKQEKVCLMPPEYVELLNRQGIYPIYPDEDDTQGSNHEKPKNSES